MVGSIGYCESKTYYTSRLFVHFESKHVVIVYVCVFVSLSILHFVSSGFSLTYWDAMVLSSITPPHKVDRYWNLTLQVGKLPPPSCTMIFFLGASIAPPHLLQPHLIVRSVQILLGFCVVGTCSHENYFTLSVDVCERFFNYTDLILFFSICKMVGSRVFFQNLFF